MKLRPYADYRDSGVECIGDVPHDWKVLPLKRLGRLKGGCGFPPSMQGRGENDLPFFKVGDLGRSPDGRYMGNTDNTITREEAQGLAATIFPIGSLVWAKIGAALSLNRRRITKKPSCIDNNMTGFVPDPAVVSTSYSFYLMSSVDFAAHAKPGAVPSFSEGDQGELPVCLPPPDAQEAIADRLDRETTRIDALVAKKTRFIELLREKRQALITQAVTKGLDPSLPMKDSGVEWLREIPSHWIVKRLKHIATIDNSGCYGSDERGSQATVCMKTCTTAHISTDGRFLFSSMEERFFSPVEASRYVGRPGDIFVVKSSGSNTNIISGKLARVGNDHTPVVFTNFLMRVRPSQSQVEPEFLECFLSSTITRRRIERMVATTTYPNINVGEYVSALIPIPPLDEQRSIAAEVNKRVSRIDAVIAKAERSIELLCEHRAALITAAVTGKIDLRNAA